jgi:hypothetical protein
MLTDYSLLNWKPVRDFCFIRELPVTLPGLILSGIDLNRSADHSPVLYGMVEAVGPRVTLVAIGDRVAYEIGAGEFRLPGDDMVRIMYEKDVAWVDECHGCSALDGDKCQRYVSKSMGCGGYTLTGIHPPCPGIDLGDGQFSGCTATGGDCPTCGR